MGLAAPQLLEKCQDVVRKVEESALLNGEIVSNEVTLYIDKKWIVHVIGALKTDPDVRFDMLSDITAVDYLLMDREPRFDVVYHLYSFSYKHRLRLKSPVAEDECEIESICSLWSGANFPEREVFDMFGIRFANHPNLTRILMPEDWKGHPLRKDFPIGGSKSFYFKHETSEYAGEPDDLVPRIRIQEGDVV